MKSPEGARMMSAASFSRPLSVFSCLAVCIPGFLAVARVRLFLERISGIALLLPSCGFVCVRRHLAQYRWELSLVFYFPGYLFYIWHLGQADCHWLETIFLPDLLGGGDGK